MEDINRALRLAIETGKVFIGIEQAESSVKKGIAKLIVVAQNFPEKFLKKIETVSIYKFQGSNIELGAICGKPFPISTLTIIEEGESNILSLAKGEKWER